MSMQELKELIARFGYLPAFPKQAPTLLQIAGYPRYEYVCNNILAFFLDPRAPHGFGTLLLDGLFGGAVESGAWANASVDREVSTDEGNRIEIVVQSDSYLLAIVNQVLGEPARPFADYSAYLAGKAERRKVLKTILAPEQTPAGEPHGFTSMAHAELVQIVRPLIESFTPAGDARYKVFLLDFLNTFESLQKGTGMDGDVIRFLNENGEQVVGLLRVAADFRAELRTKVQTLGSMLDLTALPNVRQWFFRESPNLFDCLVHDIQIEENFRIAVDAALRASGWEITVFDRSGDPARLRLLLGQLGVPTEERDRFVYTPRFGYDEPLESVHPHLQELIRRLATSGGKTAPAEESAGAAEAATPGVPAPPEE